MVTDAFEECQCAHELCYSLRPFRLSGFRRTSCAFGLHTKFSTTVEKPVENREKCLDPMQFRPK